MLIRSCWSGVISFLVFHAMIINCYAQPGAKVDSMLNVLKTAKEDTSRVNTLNNLSKQYLRGNQIAEAKKYANDALLLAQKLSFKKGEAAVHRHIGMIYTREYNSEEARKSFRMLLKISQEINDKYETAVAYNNIANSYFSESNYPEALVNHYASLKVKKEIGDKPGIIMSYNNIGLTYWNSGNYPEAYKSYTNGLKAREEMKDLKGVAHSYNVLGIVYDDEGNYPEALKNYFASLKLYEKLGLKFGMAACYNNIGELYRKQSEHSEALKNFVLAVKLSKEIEDDGLVSMAQNNMSGVYKDLGQYDEARKYCLASLRLSEESGDKQGMAFAYGNMSILYLEEGKTLSNSAKQNEYYTLALDQCNKGLKLFEETDFPDGVVESYITIGSVHTELKNYPEARKFLTEGLALAKKRAVQETVKNGYLALARLDSITGNWRDALFNKSAYFELRDSSVNAENTGKILRLQLQHEFSKKEDSLNYWQVLSSEKLKQQTLLNSQQQQLLLLNEKDLALMSQEKNLRELRMEKDSVELAGHKINAEKNQTRLESLNNAQKLQLLEIDKQKQVKNYLIIGTCLVLLLVFFIYRNYRDKQQLKLYALRNKIASDLHDDIGSTLSSISIFSQIAQQQSSEVKPMLESIDENSRKMLDAMADIVWTINPENDQFDKIVLRMRSFAYELLGAKKIEFEFQADDETVNRKLSMEVRKNLYLIFKEATNNMVKYADASKAQFTIRSDKNILSMLIKDNGKGFDTHNTGSGNGIRNMKKRAEEMGADLLISSTKGNGTSIELRVAV